MRSRNRDDRAREEGPDESRNPSGRPTALTPTLQAQLCKLVGLGVPIKVACGAEGIGKATYYRWRDLGRTGRQPYADFLREVELARSKAEAAITVNLIAATKKDWRASAWWLERVRRDRYGGKQTVRLEKAPADMSDAELDAAIAKHGYVRVAEAKDTTGDNSAEDGQE